jgi:hypothetical protein
MLGSKIALYHLERMPTCRYCGVNKPTSSAVKKHIQLTWSCRKNYLAELSNTRFNVAEPNFSADGVSYRIDVSDNTGMCSHGAETEQEPMASHGVTMEDTPSDEDDSVKWNTPAEWPRYSDAYPGAAGTPISSAWEKTRFEQIRDAEDENGPWGCEGFESEEEWEVAKWLLHNAGQNQIEHFLKLPMVHFCERTSD